ncbi:hypothetical protein DKB58_01735 [Capnocytophaga canimorsus]|nr:hypothetical protein DKB58_01735 [Capnocytophaga canimorsus]
MTFNSNAYRYCNAIKRKLVKHITNFEGFKLPHNLDYYNEQLATLLRKNIRLYEYDFQNKSYVQNEYDSSSEPVFEIGFQNSNTSAHLCFTSYIDRTSQFSLLTSKNYLYFSKSDFIRNGKYVTVLSFTNLYDFVPGANFEPYFPGKPKGTGLIHYVFGFTDEQEAIKFVEIMSNFTKEANEYE